MDVHHDSRFLVIHWDETLEVPSVTPRQKSQNINMNLLLEYVSSFLAALRAKAIESMHALLEAEADDDDA